MGDYHNHFCTFAASYLGYATWNSDYNALMPFRNWFCEEFDVDVRTFRDIKLAYRQGGQKRNMPVRLWARTAVNLARDKGAEVWITTTRPYMRLDNIDPDTRFWLQRHGIKYDYLIYGEHKYEELSRQVDPDRVCFVLEDLAYQIDEAQRLFDPDACFMYQTRWNEAFHQAYPGLCQAEELYDNLTRSISKWTAEH